MIELKQCQKHLMDVRKECDSIKTTEFEKAAIQSKLEGDLERFKQSFHRLDADRDELQRVCDEQSERIEELREKNSRLQSDNVELARALATSRQEIELISKRIDEREFELLKVNKQFHNVSSDMMNKEAVILSLQEQMKGATTESLELTRANQLLMMEIDQLRDRIAHILKGQNTDQEELGRVMERLTVTERERDDVLEMYKQVIKSKFSTDISHRSNGDENVAILATAECQVLREKLAERQKEIDALKARFGKEARKEDSERLIEKNRELETQVTDLRRKIRETTSAENLEKTIEQQYALIGEMDAEHARLIVENSRLREQLAIVKAS
jgi:chromosome segregation ATPase